MTEDEIRQQIASLHDAIVANDKQKAMGLALSLIGGFLVTINRIADAIETKGTAP